MKVVYCSSCGQALPITLRGLPAYGRIINLIPPHECTEEVQELDLGPPADTGHVVSGEDKFVQKLNELKDPPFQTAMGPGDLRAPEHKKSGVTSTAPQSTIDMVKEGPLGDSPVME